MMRQARQRQSEEAAKLEAPAGARRIARLWAASAVMLACLSVGADPRIPKSDDEVLEVVRPAAGEATQDPLAKLQAELTWNRQNPEFVEKFVRDCFQRLREESDPRYLGYAQGALTPWLQSANPPVGIWHLRAVLKQSMHQFEESLTDLDALLKSHPDHVPAMLTKAAVLQVVGRFSEARRAVFQLATRAPGLLGITAAASLSALTGEAKRAMDLLEEELKKPAEAQEKLWALTVLAETAARTGQTPRAAKAMDEAQMLGIRDVYLSTLIADFFLDANHPRDVVELLAEQTRVDGLLLRLALAEKALEPPPKSLATHVEALKARFEAAAQRGDSMHQREEARFELHLQNNPAKALGLALKNWGVQREPADARILLEAAIAANDKAAAKLVKDWMTETRLEDVRISALLIRFEREGGLR